MEGGTFFKIFQPRDQQQLSVRVLSLRKIKSPKYKIKIQGLCSLKIRMIARAKISRLTSKGAKS